MTRRLPVSERAMVKEISKGCHRIPATATAKEKETGTAGVPAESLCPTLEVAIPAY